MKYIVSTGDFQGTPFTVWGSYELGGVDAVVFGNSTPTSNNYAIQQMTHGQILSAFANPTSQFALSDYAAADVYVAMICGTINNSAPVCSLSSVKGIETQMGI